MAVDETVTMLEGMGFFEYVLPFMLIFVIVYAVLKKTGVLGDEKQINATAALVIALFVLYFARMLPIGAFFSFFFGRGTTFLVILVLALAMSIFISTAITKNNMNPFGSNAATLNIAIFAAVAFMMFSAISSSPEWSEVVFGTASVGIGSGAISSIAVLAVIGAFIAWAVKG